MFSFATFAFGFHPPDSLTSHFEHSGDIGGRFVQSLPLLSCVCLSESVQYNAQPCVAWVDSPLRRPGVFMSGGAPCGFRVWDFWGWGCTLHSLLGTMVLQKAPPLIDTHTGNTHENERFCTKLTFKRKECKCVEWKFDGC